MPRGRRRLPEACVERIRAADLLVHAGDFSTDGRLRGDRGPGAARWSPCTATSTTPGCARGCPSGRRSSSRACGSASSTTPGPTRGRLARLRGWFADADAVIFGHSHLPLHEREGGFEIFNPGSPTERRRAPSHTMGVAMVEGGRVRFRHVDVLRRGEAGVAGWQSGSDSRNSIATVRSEPHPAARRQSPSLPSQATADARAGAGARDHPGPRRTATRLLALSRHASLRLAAPFAPRRAVAWACGEGEAEEPAGAAVRRSRPARPRPRRARGLAGTGALRSCAAPDARGVAARDALLSRLPPRESDPADRRADRLRRGAPGRAAVRGRGHAPAEGQAAAVRARGRRRAGRGCCRPSSRRRSRRRASTSPSSAASGRI